MMPSPACCASRHNGLTCEVPPTSMERSGGAPRARPGAALDSLRRFVPLMPSDHGVRSQDRLPTIGNVSRLYVHAGILLFWSFSAAEHNQRLASYVDRILRGANPAGLPVEQPTKFEIVINLKTAKALGLTIPPALLARADEVIE